MVSVAEAEPEKALLPESSPEQDSGKPRKSDRKKKVPEKEPEAAVGPEAEPEASPKKPVRRAPKAKTEEPKPARRTRKVSGQQSGPPAVKEWLTFILISNFNFHSLRSFDNLSRLNILENLTKSRQTCGEHGGTLAQTPKR